MSSHSSGERDSRWRPKGAAPAREDVLYGIHAVSEAVESRGAATVIVAQGGANPRVQHIIDQSRAHGISVRFAPRPSLTRQAGTERHQGVIALCAPKPYDDLESLISAREKPLIVALDGVEDPANLGAIVRTVVATDASGVVIPERRAAGISSAVAKAAAGALERARVARVANLVRALLDLKERGLWVYGFEPGASKSLWDLDLTGGCVLVMGGEAAGLHRLVRETCDERASIPLAGPVASLNVSVAAAVVLYEAVRQRSHS